MKNNETDQVKERQNGLLNALPYGLAIFDRHGYLSECNWLSVEHFDWQEEPTGSEVHYHVLFASLPGLIRFVDLFYEGSIKQFDLREVSIDARFLHVKGKRYNHDLLITSEDVTQSKVTDIAALNAMLEGQEGERQRLAKELHDGIGPLLSTTRLNLDMILSEAQLQSRYRKKLENANEMLGMMADDLRSISHALMPGAIVDFGLIKALQNLCIKANENGKVHIHFFYSGKQERFDQQIELGLYRIAQELINNALKHGQASQINVQLIRFSSSLLLMIEDDGIGFSPILVAGENHAGIGLRNVKTRTKTLGGKFNLDTRPGSGVSVTVEVPA